MYAGRAGPYVRQARPYLSDLCNLLPKRHLHKNDPADQNCVRGTLKFETAFTAPTDRQYAENLRFLLLDSLAGLNRSY